MGVTGRARIRYKGSESGTISRNRQGRLRISLQQTRRLEDRQLSTILRSQHQGTVA